MGSATCDGYTRSGLRTGNLSTAVRGRFSLSTTGRSISDLLLHACMQDRSCSSSLKVFFWSSASPSYPVSTNYSINCLPHTSESQPICVSKAPLACTHPQLVYLLRLRHIRHAGELFEDADLLYGRTACNKHET